MLAVDTNVVVRYLTADDAKQFAVANSLVGREDLYISSTVLLETEWVLRSVYRYGRARRIEALRAFAGLPRIIIEDPVTAARSFDWAELGMDFADALHLAKAESCEAFISFDQRLQAVANRIGQAKVRAP
jgi:predicted nucleic-acid-binding protein